MYCMTNFSERMNEVLAGIKAMSDAHMEKHYPSLPKYAFTLDEGRRYVRVVRNDTGGSTSRCVWGFVDKTNGDILKAAGWKAPAKHARGNIFNENPLSNCNEYGPNYLR